MLLNTVGYIYKRMWHVGARWKKFHVTLTFKLAMNMITGMDTPISQPSNSLGRYLRYLATIWLRTLACTQPLCIKLSIIIADGMLR